MAVARLSMHLHNVVRSTYVHAFDVFEFRSAEVAAVERVHNTETVLCTGVTAYYTGFVM